MNLGPLQNWTSDENRRECAAVMIVKRFVALAVVGRNLVVYDRNRLERDTVSGAWKQRWAVLSRWCLGILVDFRFADIQFVRCEQKLFYCRKLRDTIDANMEVAGEDPGLQCWFLDKPYTSMYLTQEGAHQKSALK